MPLITMPSSVVVTKYTHHEQICSDPVHKDSEKTVTVVRFSYFDNNFQLYRTSMIVMYAIELACSNLFSPVMLN